MNSLILINGCGGAGNETTARLLLGRLRPSAWIDIKALIKVEPWVYDETLLDLGARNGAALAGNFMRAGYPQVIFSGGVGNQHALDLICVLASAADHVYYFWLHADKAIRDRRRLARARDAADRPEYLDAVDAVMADPGPLSVRAGSYHRIDTGGATADAVAAAILTVLAVLPPTSSG